MQNPTYLIKLCTISKFAWYLIKEKNYSRSEAYKLSWKIYKLKNKMSNGIADFTFVKKDGTTRHAEGTLSFNVMPADASTFKGTDKNQSPSQIRYYDMQSHGWRSFLAENLM